jgi:hypothetical protein
MDSMQSTVEALLDQLAATSSSEREMGDKFEHLRRLVRGSTWKM